VFDRKSQPQAKVGELSKGGELSREGRADEHHAMKD